MAPAATSMTNEANREEALKCLHLSRQYWQSNQKGAALKYASKSVSLFETADGRAWLEKIRVEWTGDEKEEEAKEGPPAKEEPRKTSPSSQSETSKASFTAEQVAEVKKFSKINKNDYYAVLGVTKTASEADIKKAYRKVTVL